MGLNLGIIVRTDNTGLGYQSRALKRMLHPSKLLEVANGEDIPSFDKFEAFLDGLDVMITCETPYTYEAWNWARLKRVKTYCQPNWEFFDGLIQPNMPHPDWYLMPSKWMLEEMQELFPNTIYLPPPTIESDFQQARKINLSRTGKRRFVHIIGRNAIYDRNGWSSIMDAMPGTNSDFELVVYSQQEMTGYADPRITYKVFDIEDQAELYTDFDALILPRRYGGLCLPMNEALLSGLPVIMTDIEPNKILPKNWLLPAYKSASFEGRATIDVYSPDGLAQKIDELCKLPAHTLKSWKQTAYKLGHENFSDITLKPKYQDLFAQTVLNNHNANIMRK